jgi:sulfotransferase
MQYHFITGLPRSGSTLLAAILRQNPDFTSNIMSPVGRIITQLHEDLGPVNEAEIFLTDPIRKRMCQAIFNAYYADMNAKVAFDNNRRWATNADLLSKLYPDCKIICCVRNPVAIIDSLERLLRRNALTLSSLVNSSNTTVYSRVVQYLEPSGGLFGFAWAGLRDAFYGPQRDRLLFMNYDHLAQYPREMMDLLHEKLGYEHFKYDFNNIAALPKAREFDARLGTPGLHSVNSKVVYEPRSSILPPDIAARLPKPFWEVKEEVTPPK